MSAITGVAWLHELRRAGVVLSDGEHRVLTELALYVADRGAREVSNEILMDRSGKSVATVKRATGKAAAAGFLVLRRRGGRSGDGSLRPNVWALAVPASTAQPEVSTAQEDGLNGSPVSPTVNPTGSVKKRERAERNPDVIEAIRIASRCPTIRHAPGFIAGLVRDGDLEDWLERNRPVPPPKPPARPAERPVETSPTPSRPWVPPAGWRALVAAVS